MLRGGIAATASPHGAAAGRSVAGLGAFDSGQAVVPPERSAPLPAGCPHPSPLPAGPFWPPGPPCAPPGPPGAPPAAPPAGPPGPRGAPPWPPPGPPPLGPPPAPPPPGPGSSPTTASIMTSTCMMRRTASARFSAAVPRWKALTRPSVRNPITSVLPCTPLTWPFCEISAQLGRRICCSSSRIADQCPRTWSASRPPPVAAAGALCSGAGAPCGSCGAEAWGCCAGA